MHSLLQKNKIILKIWAKTSWIQRPEQSIIQSVLAYRNCQPMPIFNRGVHTTEDLAYRLQNIQVPKHTWRTHPSGSQDRDRTKGSSMSIVVPSPGCPCCPTTVWLSTDHLGQQGLSFTCLISTRYKTCRWCCSQYPAADEWHGSPRLHQQGWSLAALVS